MSWIIKICGAAIVTAALTAVLKTLGSKLSFALTVAALSVILIMIVGKAAATVEMISSAYCAPLILKSLGISISVKTVSDICRDCGEDTLAGIVETAGKLGILIICLPYITGLIETATEIMS